MPSTASFILLTATALAKVTLGNRTPVMLSASTRLLDKVKESKEQMFDFRESLVIATVVSIVLLLFACMLLWLCNKTHQIVQDGDLEKGERLFEEMLNPDYK